MVQLVGGTWGRSTTGKREKNVDLELQNIWWSIDAESHGLRDHHEQKFCRRWEVFCRKTKLGYSRRDEQDGMLDQNLIPTAHLFWIIHHRIVARAKK